jgi:Nucleoside 2-deoxyribosyltransferase like
MSKVVKPLNNLSSEEITLNVLVFLAGTIDMGNSEDWQANLYEDLKHLPNTIFLNPRRDGWDPSWEHDPNPGSKFYEQVDWELTHLEISDIIFFNFLPGSSSPITLLELGLHSNLYQSIVCCPKDYHRYGNVKIVCDRYNIPFFENYEDSVKYLESRIYDNNNYG